MAIHEKSGETTNDLDTFYIVENGQAVLIDNIYEVNSSEPDGYNIIL